MACEKNDSEKDEVKRPLHAKNLTSVLDGIMKDCKKAKYKHGV